MNGTARTTARPVKSAPTIPAAFPAAKPQPLPREAVPYTFERASTAKTAAANNLNGLGSLVDDAADPVGAARFIGTRAEGKGSSGLGSPGEPGAEARISSQAAP